MPHWPDWRDATAYAPLLDADRCLFAWEWLRRDRSYGAAAIRALSGSMAIAEAAPAAERFGLVAFEPPSVPVPHARPMWRSDVHPFVLRADLCRGEGCVADEIDPERMRDIALFIAGSGAEHLLLTDGLRSVRLDGPPGAFTSGPVCLRYLIEGVAAAEAPLLSLRRFLAFCRMGRFSRLLHPREVRAPRWIMMLRAFDGLRAGADQRQIAQELFSSSAVEPRWRSREPTVRSQVQRLVRSSRRFAADGYRQLLQ